MRKRYLQYLQLAGRLAEQEISLRRSRRPAELVMHLQLVEQEISRQRRLQPVAHQTHPRLAELLISNCSKEVRRKRFTKEPDSPDDFSGLPFICKGNEPREHICLFIWRMHDAERIFQLDKCKDGI